MKLKALSLAMCVAAALAAGCSSSSDDEGSQKPYVIAAIGKVQSPWFDRYAHGVKQACAETDNRGMYASPTVPDPDGQISLMQDYLARGVDALLIVPNDAAALAEAIEEAQDAGISVVLHEAQGINSEVYDLEMFDNEAFGLLFAREMTAKAEQNGSYAVILASESVTAQNQWADAAVGYLSTHRPDLKFLGKYYVPEDREAARTQAAAIYAAHSDLKGLISLCSEDTPGVAEGIADLGLSKQVTFIGASTPNVARPYLKSGAMDTLVLWDPAEAGRAMVYMAQALIENEGTLPPDFAVNSLGPSYQDGMTFFFNRPLKLDKDTVDLFDF